MELDSLKEKFAFVGWLDSFVISDLITEVLEENHLPADFNYMKEVWLGALNELPDIITARVYRLKALLKKND